VSLDAIYRLSQSCGRESHGGRGQEGGGGDYGNFYFIVQNCAKIVCANFICANLSKNIFVQNMFV
jgi:hypothetical protein